MLKVYGIRQCDTCRRAIRWLESEGIAYHFHDVRQDGLTRVMITAWLESLSMEQLANRRSTTWRQLSEAERADVSIDTLLAHPTLIKRPVFESDGGMQVGFDPHRLRELLN